MCGIFGVFNARKAAELSVIGLHGIQHRAIDYAGIVSTDGEHFYRERGRGIARQVFSKEMLDRLHGKSAIGHIRYPTVADNPTKDNTQPIQGQYGGESFALAHNGNLTNTAELAALVEPLTLSTSMDTEYIVRLLQKDGGDDFEKSLARVCCSLRGSYALVILLKDRLIAVRDPSGNRPLSIGEADGAYFISSETCVFPNLSADHIVDVAPGAIVTIESSMVRSKRFADRNEKKCRFEGIYFSHPASVVFGENVARFRMSVGRMLEAHFPVDGADIVTPVPDSSTFIAQGFGESGRSGVFFPVIFRSHYVGRTFIAATQSMRDEKVAQKFTFSSEEVAGKRIVVVDDSIVRGTTLPKIVEQLRRLGAREVHVRIGSPPITHPCMYGINTPTKRELLSSSATPEEIRQKIGADSLEFLPIKLLRSISREPDTYCWSCMIGDYW